MTEKEALTKWCPFARLASTTGPFNRDADGDISRRGLGLSRVMSPCIGSACMAFRSKQIEHRAGEYKEFVHCGLAGKP